MMEHHLKIDRCLHQKRNTIVVCFDKRLIKVVLNRIDFVKLIWL